MKRLLKDKRGMTLMEIVVALTLLMIVIVGTTPVMLSAFDGLYKAGEKTQEVYDAKTEIEQNLATRSSSINYKGFLVNFNGLGQAVKINGNRAVSSLYNSLETIFTGAKARVYIASGSVVNDDTSSHTIILQTSNIDFKNIAEIGVNGEETLSPRDDKTQAIETLVDVTAYIPQKELTSTLAADIYKNQKAVVTLHADSTNVETGRIGITISGTAENPIDFTTSPIKIVLKYLDENDKEQKVHTYLTIKTPTIMFAGATSDDITYYTTAGVVKEINKDGSYKTSFTAEARKMNIGKVDSNGTHTTGAQSTQAVPTGTVFKSINWITEYAKTTGGLGNENVDFADTDYEPQYYVLTGTNGAIYRTYSFNESPNVVGEVNLKKLNEDAEKVALDIAPGINGRDLNTKTNQNQDGVDVMGVKDTYIVLDDRASTIVYPAVWGGDFSHIFGWSSYENEMGYISRSTVNKSQPSTAYTWQTEDSSNPGTGEPGYYSNFASYGYYYNGWGATTSYYTMNSRKISYILTEVPDSMRIGGNLDGIGSSSDSEYGYDGSTFDRIWERPLSLDLNTSWEIPESLRDWDDGWFYTSENDSKYLVRAVIFAPEDGDKYFNDVLKVPVYIGRSDGNRPDNGMAQLRLKALTTLSPEFLYTRLNVEDDSSSDNPNDVNFVYNKTYNQSKITVTDAVYIPSTTGGAGTVFYVGTVAAYGWINQVDNVGVNDGEQKYNEDNGHDVAAIGEDSTRNTGRLSSYWIVSSDDGTSTTIYKTSSLGDSGIDHFNLRTSLMDSATRKTNYYGTTATDLNTPIKANSTESHQFFITQPIPTSGRYSETTKEGGFLGIGAEEVTRYYFSSAQVSGRVFSDVAFTMGYTSNREMVYTNIVYGKIGNKLQQALKFCEPLYFQSHYHDANKLPDLYMNSFIDGMYTNGVCSTTEFLNSTENDYYNVWLPGEMYNLTKVATKDNVTVAVGYAVAGSTYSYHNTLENASTALGGIYNDGVISGMVLGQDNAFKSLLYFKDPEFDSTSLTNGTVTYTRNGNNGSTDSNVHGSTGNTYASLKTWPTGYGTHARDSVQFTCVDISIVQLGEWYTYYAYYADNKGRVFRSLVAYKNVDDSVATMMNYVSDEIIEPVKLASDDASIATLYNGGVGRMEEIKVNGTEPFTNYFSEIKSIVCDESHIVVTGKSKGNDFNIVVGTITPTYDDPDSKDKIQIGVTITWKNTKISNAAAAYTIEDMMVLGDYIYTVGTSGHHTPSNVNDDNGFILAVSTPYLDTLSHNGEILDTRQGNADGYYFWGDAGHDTDGDGVGDEDHVKMPIYAIAGKTT